MTATRKTSNHRLPPCSPASRSSARNPRHARSLRSLRVAPGCCALPLTPAAPRRPSEGVGTRGVALAPLGKFDSPPAGRTRGRMIAFPLSLIRGASILIFVLQTLCLGRNRDPLSTSYEKGTNNSFLEDSFLRIIRGCE